jgi:uncharacterized membrane protein YeaQ/YmgE (transglycosylase-associated protein family)
MWIIAWILLGTVAGVLTNRFTRTQSLGLVSDVLLGVFGAALAGFAFNMLAGREDGPLSLWGLFASLLGAVLVVAVSGVIFGRSVPSPARPPRAGRIRRYR